ncbi:MAG: hypothetical protein WCO43_02200 [Chitinophagia bacterium]
MKIDTIKMMRRRSPALSRELATIVARMAQPEKIEIIVAIPKTTPKENPTSNGHRLFFSVSPFRDQYSKKDSSVSDNMLQN